MLTYYIFFFFLDRLSLACVRRSDGDALPALDRQGACLLVKPELASSSANVSSTYCFCYANSPFPCRHLRTDWTMGQIRFGVGRAITALPGLMDAAQRAGTCSGTLSCIKVRRNFFCFERLLNCSIVVIRQENESHHGSEVSTRSSAVGSKLTSSMQVPFLVFIHSLHCVCLRLMQCHRCFSFTLFFLHSLLPSAPRMWAVRNVANQPSRSICWSNSASRPN